MKIPGSLWVEVNDLHYVDQFAREWLIRGIGVKDITGSGARPGSIWVDNVSTAALHYINETGTAVYRTPAVFVKALGVAQARLGSMWVGEDNMLHHIGPGSPAYSDIRAHTDIPTVSTHTDTHADSPHGDSPHSDGPHSDVPAGFNHLDTHNDTPHYDFHDSAHGDHSDGEIINHTDFNDTVYYYHPQYLNNFADSLVTADYHGDYFSPSGAYHIDYVQHKGPGDPAIPINSRHDDFTNHQDVPHGDSPHIDSHSDSPHQDQSGANSHSDHTDNIPHQDVAHVDVPHVDGHTDVHADTHGDVAHDDTPTLIGP